MTTGEDTTELAQAMGPFYEWIAVRLRGPRVLDVGCGVGSVGRLRPDLDWAGIEADAQRANVARRHYRRVEIGEAEDPGLVRRFQQGEFETILFCDVLEHIYNPPGLLNLYRSLLTPSGQIIAAIPNVVHFNNRRNVLLGRWDYEDGGILDRTHLRFYTFASAQQLLVEAGFRIEERGTHLLVPRLLRWIGSRAPANLFSTHLLAVCRPV